MLPVRDRHCLARAWRGGDGYCKRSYPVGWLAFARALPWELRRYMRGLVRGRPCPIPPCLRLFPAALASGVEPEAFLASITIGDLDQSQVEVGAAWKQLGSLAGIGNLKKVLVRAALGIITGERVREVLALTGPVAGRTGFLTGHVGLLFSPRGIKVSTAVCGPRHDLRIDACISLAPLPRIRPPPLHPPPPPPPPALPFLASAHHHYIHRRRRRRRLRPPPPTPRVY